MDDIPERRRTRTRVATGAVVLLLLVGLGCAVLVSLLGARGTMSPVARPTPTGSAPVSGSGASAGATIFVHILGAVQKPGLYQLRDGDRGVDAVAAAGGFATDADQAGLNLARFVVDGEQIVVPVLGQAPVAVPGVGEGGKVNLNTADATTLETLPRVGPAMAARIIDWRDANGRFTAIEDLMSVTGIGDKTFEGLKDLITI